jgi:hypothetical protein
MRGFILSHKDGLNKNVFATSALYFLNAIALATLD